MGLLCADPTRPQTAGTEDVALTHHGDRRVHITSLIWLPEIIAKLEVKHGVTVEEIAEVFEMGPCSDEGQRASGEVKMSTGRMAGRRPAGI